MNVRSTIRPLPPTSRPRRWMGLARALCLLLLSGLPPVATAQSASLSNKNPFLPPGYGEPKEEAPPPKRPQTNGPIARQIEFRGVIQMGETYRFSLFHKSEQKSYWIPENGVEDGLSVRGFDPDSMTVTVDLRGQAERLTLMSSSDSPMPVQKSAPKQAAQAQIPKELRPKIGNNRGNNDDNKRRRVVPRRRVILPKRD